MTQKIRTEDLMKPVAVFEMNEQRGCREGQEPCHLCGAPTEPRFHIHIVGYGDTITDDPIEGEDSIGWHPVGPNCFKRVKKAFGGDYPEMVQDINRDSMVIAVGNAAVKRFEKQVEKLVALAPEDERDDFLECIAGLVADMKGQPKSKSGWERQANGTWKKGGK